MGKVQKLGCNKKVKGNSNHRPIRSVSELTAWKIVKAEGLTAYSRFQEKKREEPAKKPRGKKRL